MECVILAGGLGTRLRPFTCFTPKPLLPLVGIPFIEYQLALIKSAKIKDVLISTNLKFKNFKWFMTKNMNIKFVYESTSLGTGGGLRNCLDYIKGEDVFVFNGDVITDIDLNEMFEFHRKKKAKITIALVKVDNPTFYGVVEFDDEFRIQRFIEKPSPDEVKTNTINAGVYIISTELISNIPKDTEYSIERSFFPNLLNKGVRFYAYLFSSYWLDIGNHKNYLKANFDILDDKFKPPFQLKKKGTVFIDSGTEIARPVSFNGHVVIGKNCYIGSGCSISDSVILDGSEICENVIIKNCIIGKDCKISAHSELQGVMLSDKSHINIFTKINV